MCLGLPVTYKIWLGLYLTPTIEYRPYSLNNRDGFILEAAKLYTGDLLVRIPHAWNSFMACPDLEHLMLKHKQTWSRNSAYYTPIYVTRSTCTINPITQSLDYTYDSFNPAHNPHKLSSSMLHYLKSKHTKTKTTHTQLEMYNNPGLMHALFVMHVQKDNSTSDRFRPRFITRPIASEHSFFDDISGHSQLTLKPQYQETSDCAQRDAPLPRDV
jgi:hypothetical protein